MGSRKQEAGSRKQEARKEGRRLDTQHWAPSNSRGNTVHICTRRRALRSFSYENIWESGGSLRVLHFHPDYVPLNLRVLVGLQR